MTISRPEPPRREAAPEAVVPLVGGAAGRRWLGVEFRHLGALAAVAREGSFRRAAESLGYVQSAISGQIAQLERAVGMQLVERSSGAAGASLTPAGTVLLSHVGEILSRFEAARVDLRALTQAGEAAVRISVLEGIGRQLLPAIVTAFIDRMPGAEVVIDENREDERNFDRLATGDLDLMITDLPLPPGPFEYALLGRDEYVLLVAADSELAAQPGPPSLAQLSRLPLILPAPRRHADPVATRLRDSLLDQPPWLRPHDIATTQALVGAGLGAAVVPELAVDPADGATAAVKLPSLLPARLIALVKHREREYPAAVRMFAEVVEGSFEMPSAHGLDELMG